MLHTENSLWKSLFPIVRGAFADMPGVVCKRAYQGSMQADGDAPRILLHRAKSRRYGAQGKRQEWYQERGVMLETEVWRKEDTISANALVAPASVDMDAPTANDLLETLGAHLQSSKALMEFRAAGLGILRIGDVLETPYEDEQGHYAMSVSLQFTVSYTQEKTRQIPVASSVEWAVYRV